MSSLSVLVFLACHALRIMCDTSCVVQVIPSAASGLHSLCAERLFVRFPCCVGTPARQPQVCTPACMSPMHVHHVLMYPLFPGPRPYCVLQESSLQLATVCVCVCLSFFVGLVVCNSTHTPSDEAAHAPTRPCRSVPPVCMPAYLGVCLV